MQAQATEVSNLLSSTLAQETGASTWLTALPIVEHGFALHIETQYAYAMDGDLLYYHHSVFVARISQ